MTIDSTARESCSEYSSDIPTPDTLKVKAGQETHEAASFMNDSQDLLLRAQKNAVDAKEAAMGAISRFYQESQACEKKAEKMVRDLDDAIQTALDAAVKSRGKHEDVNPVGLDDDESETSPKKKKKSKLSKEVLNPGYFPFNAVSDLTKSIFGSKEFDAETRAEFYKVVMRQSPQLRQLIDDLTEDKARIKTEKIMAEAKSEIIAARVAVNHAQDEINGAKEEAKKAILEADAAKRSAEVVVSQVKQNAICQVADEIAKSKEEVSAIKEAANIALKRAEEEIKKSREQAEAANNHAQVAISLAQERVKKDTEQLKESKLQAQIVLKQTQEEAKKVEEEAEIIRRESQEALKRATLETRRAQEEIEAARNTIREVTALAEKQAYDRFCGEMKKIKEDAEANNNQAYEAIAKAREESRQAREEAEMVKKTSDAAAQMAREEVIKSREETEKAKQAMLAAVNQAQEDSRKAKEEAGAAILRANEAMMEAKQEIINRTRDEIVKARQEIEASSDLSGSPADKTQDQIINMDAHPGQSDKLDSNYVANVLHEMRAPLHSISGFAKLMLEDNVADSMTQKEFLSLMVQQSDSLNRLIDDLSGILSKNTAPFSVNKEPVSSEKMITEAINSVQGIAQQKKI